MHLDCLGIYIYLLLDAVQTGINIDAAKAIIDDVTSDRIVIGRTIHEFDQLYWVTDLEFTDPAAKAKYKVFAEMWGRNIYEKDRPLYKSGVDKDKKDE